MPNDSLFTRLRKGAKKKKAKAKAKRNKRQREREKRRRRLAEKKAAAAEFGSDIAAFVGATRPGGAAKAAVRAGERAAGPTKRGAKRAGELGLAGLDALEPPESRDVSESGVDADGPAGFAFEDMDMGLSTPGDDDDDDDPFRIL